MLTKDDINCYVDQKNALMLAVLGLHETVELFQPMFDRDYRMVDQCLRFYISNYDMNNNEIHEHSFSCGDYTWYIPRMLRENVVLDILECGEGVIEYVK